MKPKEITIDDVKYVREDSISSVPQPEGKYVIVRCKNAGVHSGHLKSRKDGILTLENSRRLWRWWSKFTLSGLATDGVLKGKESEVNFSCVVPLIDLTDKSGEVCEVIYCTEKAKQSIESIPEHKNG